MSILKKLRWQQVEDKLVAQSPTHEYRIFEDPNEGLICWYTNKTTTACSFRQIESIEDGKEWVDKVHAPSSLAPYINTPTEHFKRVQNWVQVLINEKQSGVTIEDFSTQIGVVVEEISELLEALGLPYAVSLGELSQDIYAGEYIPELNEALQDVERRKDALDAYLDITIAGCSAMRHMGCDVEGALGEVVTTMENKLVDGKTLRNEAGKVIKPEGWVAPELSPFVGTLDKQFFVPTIETEIDD